jgi:ATP-dependent helicase/nuclease subunit A
LNAPRAIPALVRSTQGRAADPEVSAFVSANAGAGKTHVLVQRVIRLLLTHVPPEKILCITFTKAAAANMAERVFSTLSDWIGLDDRALDARLRETGIALPDGRLRKRARELFARALETPGGLKVQTIHALCTRLLQQFPFEANVPARFSVLDDRDQAEMIERASLAVLLDASARPDSATGRALTFAMTCAADVTFRNIVHEACLGDGAFRSFIDQAESPEQAVAQVAQALNAGSESLADIEKAIVDGPHLPQSHWNAVAQNFDGGGKNDREQAARLRAAVPLTGTAQVRAYLGVFLTNDNDPRVNLVSRSLGRLQPALVAALDREAARLGPLIERWRAAMIRERTVALIAIASAILARYRAEKQERGLLDYDDLIDKTLAMLNRTAVGWVHYKLDRGIDHVLIDEAQDTSPKQWQIVEQLVADFASGRGVREAMIRTIFAVGDEKQSIFSFQGAAPHEFDLRHRQFRRIFEGAGLKWDADIRLNYSFRSGRVILHSVDQVFREEAIYRSIHTPAIGAPLHEALGDAAPGMIELWEMEAVQQREDIEGWDAPFAPLDAVSETSPEVKVARRTAETIAQLIAGREMTGRADARRPLTPGDVLILVRRRGRLFDAVIQALKRAHIPVAGADRLKLTEHIAIIDLMHLTDALLMPQDDLALAVALKSPLFGIGENQLYELCYGRKSSLRTALAERAKTDLYFAEAHARLIACEEKAAQAKPFEFYSWLLGADGGRARMLKRLSHEANDAIDEFLELAFAFEQREVPSLQGFVAWLRTADTEIKRDMEIGRDEVRVMTVHGAKGLEASVVFLMDTTSSPTDAPRLNLVKLPVGAPGRASSAHSRESLAKAKLSPENPEATEATLDDLAKTGSPRPRGRADEERSGDTCVVWAGRKADDCTAVANARAQMVCDIEDEYRRLLYVAMTRAAERLVIGGVMPANRNAPRADWWYQLMTRGLEGTELTKEEFQTEAGKVTRFIRPDDSLELRGSEAPAATEPAQGEPFPDWLRKPASPEQKPYETIRPSEPRGFAAPAKWSAAQAQARRHALHRGTLVHRLLQALPDIAAERRKDAADDFVARNAPAWPADERAALVGRTLDLIAHPSFASLFAAGSRAEVPIVGQLKREGRAPLMVSGQIDRLVVGTGDVVIADFKTNEAPPKTAAALPKTYLRQMALYAAVMGQLYPDKAVRAALVWTETTEITELPAETLQMELAAIISP